MVHRPKTLFVLTDGGRARFVRRVEETADFITVADLEQTGRLRRMHHVAQANPSPRAFSPFSPQGHSLGSGIPSRRAKERFMAEVAKCALALLKQAEGEALYLVAPARLAGPLERCFTAGTPINGVLAKDLTRTPNAALPRWLH